MFEFPPTPAIIPLPFPGQISVPSRKRALPSVPGLSIPAPNHITLLLTPGAVPWDLPGVQRVWKTTEMLCWAPRVPLQTDGSNEQPWLGGLLSKPCGGDPSGGTEHGEPASKANSSSVQLCLEQGGSRLRGLEAALAAKAELMTWERLSR